MSAAPPGSTGPGRLSRSRTLGYRLLPGEGYAYVLHLRPREWPIVAAHTLFGFLLAVAERPEALTRWPTALAGTAVFVLLLNGGTLAINSAFDRDSGDIGYLDDPPPPPRHLFAFGIALMIAGALLSLLLPRAFAAVYLACFLMSIVYSVPPFRWKAVAGLDLAINALGFGILTALAGWTLAGVPVPRGPLLVLLGFGPLFAALYPLTQLYQLEEDRARGDRTLALALGVRGALAFAVAMALVAFALMAAGLRLAAGSLAAAAVLLPLVAWLALLLRWLRDSPTMSPTQHKAGMYRALQAWALTDGVVLLAAFGSFA